MSQERGHTGINVFELPDGNIKELDHIIGHRVRVKDSDGLSHVGKLQFVGTNQLLPSWGLHCTIDRMPGIQIKSIMDITDLEAQEEVIPKVSKEPEKKEITTEEVVAKYLSGELDEKMKEIKAKSDLRKPKEA